MLGILYPCLKYTGEGINLKEMFISMWSGLRGPLAIVLALSFYNETSTIDE
jgi:NhaP-type Na+/H+ or K+/H+ antiporter